MTLYRLTSILTATSSFSFGLLVFVKSPNRRLAIRWFGFSLSVAIYGGGAAWIAVAKSPSMGLTAWRLTYALGVVWIPALFYDFVCIFIGRVAVRPIRSNYLLAAAFVLAVPTHAFFASTRFLFNEMFYAQGGWLYFIFCIWWFGLVIYSHILLAKEIKRVPREQSNKIKFFILATAVGFASGGINFAANLGIPIYPWGQCAIPLYPIIMSYAILRHRLMDVTILIRKTLVYSIASAGVAAVYAGVVTLLARILERQPSLPALFPNEMFRWFAYNLKISFAYSCIATALFSACLGLFVWMKGTQRKANRAWALTCWSISVWGLGLGMLVRAPDWNNAYFWGRWIQYPGAIMIPILFLHSVTLVLEIRSRWVLWLGNVLAILLQILNVSGNLVSIKTQPPFTYYTLALGNYWIFVAYFFGAVLYAHGLLLRKIFAPEERLRNQAKYLFLAMVIGFSGGATSFFPVFNIPIFPYGVYAVPIYVVIVSYAIFKHQLMDINVVIRKTLLYSLVSAALISVYVGTITLLAQVLGGRHGSTSASSSALAAIFITLLFNPLRIRTQRWLDRHFPRERLDPDLLQEAAGGFAHEMKRPLSKISLPAELTLMDLEQIKSGEKTWTEFLPIFEQRLQFIIRQSIDAGYTIEAIRELSSASAEPFEPVDVRQIIEDALRAHHDLLEKHNVAVRVDLGGSSSFVLGRMKQLEIVFINLIKNAVEAMSQLPAGRSREILISARKKEDNIVIHVKDAGAGLRTEDLEKIFQPHYTTKGPLGTGMGLYLSHQIIQAHKGIIEVSSKTDQGTEFMIRLPAKKD